MKSLLTVRAETETPVSAVSIRKIPRYAILSFIYFLALNFIFLLESTKFYVWISRVPADMPLYDILNEFQKGSSHMAAVVKVKEKTKNPLPKGDGERFDENKDANGNSEFTTPLLAKDNDKSESVVVNIAKATKPTDINKQTPSQKNSATTNSLPHLHEDIEDGEVIGIITLEDVFEELLQVNSASLFHFPLHIEYPCVASHLFVSSAQLINIQSCISPYHFVI